MNANKLEETAKSFYNELINNKEDYLALFSAFQIPIGRHEV